MGGHEFEKSGSRRKLRLNWSIESNCEEMIGIFIYSIRTIFFKQVRKTLIEVSKKNKKN